MRVRNRTRRWFHAWEVGSDPIPDWIRKGGWRINPGFSCSREESGHANRGDWIILISLRLGVFRVLSAEDFAATYEELPGDE
jgi:hypothetical protein